MAPTGKFRKNLNYNNSGYTPDRVVIFGSMGVFVDGLFNGII